MEQAKDSVKHTITSDPHQQKNSWAFDVLKNHFPESDMVEHIDNSEEVAEVRRQLVQRNIFMVHGDEDFHTYVIKVDAPTPDEENESPGLDVVMEHSETGIIQAKDLIQDDRVEVLGEFRVGVVKQNTSGENSVSVKSSLDGLLPD